MCTTWGSDPGTRGAVKEDVYIYIYIHTHTSHGSGLGAEFWGLGFARSTRNPEMATPCGAVQLVDLISAHYANCLETKCRKHLEAAKPQPHISLPIITATILMATSRFEVKGYRGLRFWVAQHLDDVPPVDHSSCRLTHSEVVLHSQLRVALGLTWIIRGKWAHRYCDHHGRDAIQALPLKP